MWVTEVGWLGGGSRLMICGNSQSQSHCNYRLKIKQLHVELNSEHGWHLPHSQTHYLYTCKHLSGHTHMWHAPVRPHPHVASTCQATPTRGTHLSGHIHTWHAGDTWWCGYVLLVTCTVYTLPSVRYFSKRVSVTGGTLLWAANEIIGSVPAFQSCSTLEELFKLLHCITSGLSNKAYAGQRSTREN